MSIENFIERYKKYQQKVVDTLSKDYTLDDIDSLEKEGNDLETEKQKLVAVLDSKLTEVQKETTRLEDEIKTYIPNIGEMTPEQVRQTLQAEVSKISTECNVS